jgi:hypothetical protein
MILSPFLVSPKNVSLREEFQVTKEMSVELFLILFNLMKIHFELFLLEKMESCHFGKLKIFKNWKKNQIQI